VLSSAKNWIQVDRQVATEMTRTLAWLLPRASTICFAVLLGAAITRAEELPQDYRVHREGLLRELAHLMSEGHREDASDLARRAMSSTSGLSRSDARRGNAIELLLQVSLPDLGRDRALAQRALAMASELVAIRRTQRPPDPQLLSVALLTQGTVLFALDRSADADRAFEERLAVLRNAYSANDVRLADQLSDTARNIEEGYGRPSRAAKLYQEAIAIRRRAGAARERSQASDLHSLGMLQMGKLKDSEAGEQSLAEASSILEDIMAKKPESWDVADGWLSLLVLRSGIAQQRGDIRQARELLDQASGIPSHDAQSALVNANTVSLGKAFVEEAGGDIDAAINEYGALIARVSKLDPAQRTDDDKGIVLDARVAQANLWLRKNNTAAARKAVEAAMRGYPADDPQLPPALFVLAEIERLDHRPERQAAVYREALKLARRVATEQPVQFSTNRKRLGGATTARFGDTSDKVLTFGKATVLVPGGQFSNESARNPTSVEAVNFGAATNPDQLTISGELEIVPPDAATQQADRLIDTAKLYSRAALVFVHGYNVTFDEALKRMGQLKRDLNFDGAAFLFSWPSAGHWWRYGTDRGTAAAAAASLAELLTWIAHSTHAERIHIIAHSMGNRVLLPALGRIDQSVVTKIGEIVFAAPAVGAADFADRIKGLVGAGFGHLTLYASQNDVALRAGFVRELGTTLAGYITGGTPLVAAGLDTIDVSEGGNETFEFNHDVFAANAALIDDIRQLLRTSTRPPGSRLKQLVSRTADNGSTYWYYVAPKR
jgi:esterase/lipase superfamily enzyme